MRSVTSGIVHFLTLCAPGFASTTAAATCEDPVISLPGGKSLLQVDAKPGQSPQTKLIIERTAQLEQAQLIINEQQSRIKWLEQRVLELEQQPQDQKPCSELSQANATVSKKPSDDDKGDLTEIQKADTLKKGSKEKGSKQGQYAKGKQQAHTRQLTQHNATTKKQEANKPVRLDPIPCRDDFADVAEKLFKKNNLAVEVGVFRGEFSAKNLKKWSGQYHMVDAWAFRPSDNPDKNFEDDAINKENRAEAEHATDFAGPRRHVLQALSVDGAKHFANSSIDWLYIDALHTKEALLQDLEAWYPKVRPGGLLSGDDYGDEKDTSFLEASRWMNFYQDPPMDVNHWGVISALHEFVKKNDLDLHVTWLNDCYHWNAWYIVKPLSPTEELALNTQVVTNVQTYESERPSHLKSAAFP